jgi:RimJ/RimL family protein N-acetyltransferase
MTRKPFLSSERLEFWKPQISDLDDLVALVDNEDTRRFLGPTRATPASQFERLMRNAGGWSLYGYGIFSVRLPGHPRIAASCGIFHSLRGFGNGLDDVPEGGWVVRRDLWGQGLASEAMAAALAWFDTVHGPRRIACMIDAGNTASERVAAKLRFVRYDKHVDENGITINLYERAAERHPWNKNQPGSPSPPTRSPRPPR